MSSASLDLEAEIEAMRLRWRAMEVAGEGVRRVYLSHALHEAIVRDRDLSCRIGSPAPNSTVFFGVPCLVTQLLDDLGRHWWVSSHVGS